MTFIPVAIVAIVSVAMHDASTIDACLNTGHSVTAWYQADQFAATSQWPDATGNGYTATVNAGTLTRIENCLNGNPCVTGTTSTKLTLGSVYVSGQHTVFNLCRYKPDGTNHQRIISARDTNSFFGFVLARSGLAFEGTVWITDAETDQFGTDWVLSSQAAGFYRGNREDYTLSGIDRNRQFAPGVLTINKDMFDGTVDQQPSDFMCAEILIFNNQILDVGEVECVENYLTDKYNLLGEISCGQTMTSILFAGEEILYKVPVLSAAGNEQLMYVWDTCDSDFDTVLSLHYSDTDELISTNDDHNGACSGSTTASYISVFADSIADVSTRSVYVKVKGSSSTDSGTYSLQMKCISADYSVTVQACDNYATTSDVTDSLVFQVSGVEATSRFFKAPASVTHQDGDTSAVTTTFAVTPESVADVGEIYKVQLLLTSGYCIQSLTFTTPLVTHSFGADYFGAGIQFEESCGASFVSPPSTTTTSAEFIPCVDDWFSLNVYEKRSVLDLSMATCITTGSGIASTANLHASVVGKTAISRAYVSEVISLSTTDAWSNSDEQRIYHLSLDSSMDEVTLVSVIYKDTTDKLCIDMVAIDDEPAPSLSAYEIGGDTGITSLFAIFQSPVCKTEVIGSREVEDGTTTNLLPADSSIAGLSCSNYNRLVSSTCSISQSYEMTKTTSFSISSESTKTSEYSWGTESSVTFGTETSESTTTSNEFSYGFDQSLTVGASASVDGLVVSAEVSTEVSMGANQQWTETNEQTSETSISSETSSSSNQQNTAGNEDSSGYETSYETSSTTTIECSAEFELPPSHSVSYTLKFNAFNTTINTLTDLKLTLCSALITPGAPEDESMYRYIYDIPGVIEHKETTSCDVSFDPMEYLQNSQGKTTCEEERALALSIISDTDYVPRCQADGSYDGCQCNLDSDLCWCVDADGNKKDNAVMVVEEAVTWQEVCVNKLQCADSSITADNYLSPVEDSMPCNTAQKLAIYNSEAYLPRCRESDTSQYDGCQCDQHAYNAPTRCWCVTTDGDNIDGKAVEVKDESVSFEQICVQMLQCANSDITYTGNAVPSNAGEPRYVFEFGSIELWAATLIVFAGIFLYRTYCAPKAGAKGKGKKHVDDYEVDEVQPMMQPDVAI